MPGSCSPPDSSPGLCSGLRDMDVSPAGGTGAPLSAPGLGAPAAPWDGHPRVPEGPQLFFPLSHRGRRDLSESPQPASSRSPRVKRVAKSLVVLPGVPEGEAHRPPRACQGAGWLPLPAVHLHSKAVTLQHAGPPPPPSPGAPALHVPHGGSQLTSHTTSPRQPHRPRPSRDGPHRGCWNLGVPSPPRSWGGGTDRRPR